MIHYEGHGVTLHHGDCLDVLKTLPDASVDAVVTDPPYGLEFMGKEWDKFDRKGPASFENLGQPLGSTRSDGTQRTGRSPLEDRPRFSTMGPLAMRHFQQWCELWAAECLRVLKPGGHLLAFGGTRTWHRLACAVEDAGFEIRDSIAWLYGSGFPKSLDVSKAIDRAAGAEREVVIGGSDGAFRQPRAMAPGGAVRTAVQTLSDPATPAAEQWQGWGTALKPAFEPVVVARKPLTGTVASNVLAHGTGALNVDACRIGDGGQLSWSEPRGIGYMGGGSDAGPVAATKSAAGRWPANVVLDESQAAALDEMSGESLSTGGSRGAGGQHGAYSPLAAQPDVKPGFGDTGGASRYFLTVPIERLEGRFMYTAKADASERPRVNGTAHPTVKPLSLMRWLVRLVTPPGGTVLEPFAGSGTTVEACILEGFRCIAVEKTDEYLPLILARIHRQRDPVQSITLAGDDLGLFGLGDVS